MWTPVEDSFWPCELSDASQDALDRAAKVVASRYDESEPPLLDELEELLAVAAEAGPAAGKIVGAVREALAMVKGDFNEDIESQRDQVGAASTLIAPQCSLRVLAGQKTRWALHNWHGAARLSSD